MSNPTTTGELADWILNRLPATGGDVDFTRLELETRINVALAAEREKADKAINAANKLTGENIELEAQLAAEREIHEAAVRTSKHAINELHQQLAAEREESSNALEAHMLNAAKLQKQLAAEREAVEQYKVAFENANDTCSTLREQLAAERKKNDDWRNTERRVANTT